MKNKIFTILTIGVLLVTMSIPALAKSNSFDFTMKYRVVDGSTNKEYHSLKGGTYPSISGSMRQSGGTTNTTLRNKIYAELCNKTSGNSFGSVTLGRPTLDGKATGFSGKFDKKTGGGSKYYLIIYRTESDGRIMTGSGTLKD